MFGSFLTNIIFSKLQNKMFLSKVSSPEFKNSNNIFWNNIWQHHRSAFILAIRTFKLRIILILQNQ